MGPSADLFASFHNAVWHSVVTADVDAGGGRFSAASSSVLKGSLPDVRPLLTPLGTAWEHSLNMRGLFLFSSSLVVFLFNKVIGNYDRIGTRLQCDGVPRCLLTPTRSIWMTVFASLTPTYIQLSCSIESSDHGDVSDQF